MSRPAHFVHCAESEGFDPEELIQDTHRLQQARDFLTDKSHLYNATRVMFNLPERDKYVYHAVVSVSLSQVQGVVGLGGVNNLHKWYLDAPNTEVRTSLVCLPILETKPRSKEARPLGQMLRLTSPSSSRPRLRRRRSRTWPTTPRRALFEVRLEPTSLTSDFCIPH